MKVSIYCKFCEKEVTSKSFRCKSCSNKQRKVNMSEEAKINISNAQKKRYDNGAIAWNKGLTKEHPSVKKYLDKIYTKERAKKISISKKGKKRKPFSFSWRMAMSQANIKSEKWKREKNPGWKGGTMDNKPKHISRYHGLRVFEWLLLRKKIINRDHSICNICKTFCKPPVVDHIIPYRINEDNSEKNLQILCRKCHAKKDYYWREDSCVV